MSKKKKPDDMTTQLTIRLPKDLLKRIEDAAKNLATDRSHLMRIVLAEKIAEYESRGRKALAGGEHEQPVL